MLAMILENIRSVHNVGTMFRSADAFGVKKIYCVGYTPTPDRFALQKTALGAEKTVPFVAGSTIREAIGELKSEGYTVVALETGNGAVPLRSVAASEKVALILGNEVEGVSEAARSLADHVAYIPMRGAKESLNVAAAAAIALFWFDKP